MYRVSRDLRGHSQTARDARSCGASPGPVMLCRFNDVLQSVIELELSLKTRPGRVVFPRIHRGLHSAQDDAAGDKKQSGGHSLRSGCRV